MQFGNKRFALLYCDNKGYTSGFFFFFVIIFCHVCDLEIRAYSFDFCLDKYVLH